MLRRYYWLWLKTAFTHSMVGHIDLWIGLTAAVLGIADHYWPQAQLMGSVWQLPVWVLAAVMVARLLIAPYWMWQEDQQKRLRQHVLSDSVMWVRIDSNGLTALTAAHGVDAPPVQFTAMAVKTERLRAFVDYSGRQLNGPDTWSERIRVPLIEVDAVNGVQVAFQVAFRSPAEPSRIYIGNPQLNYPISPASPTRCRLVIIGANGMEQRHYFVVVQCQLHLVLTREREILDWIDEWERA